MKIKKKNIFALIVTLIFTVIVFYNIDFAQVINTFKIFQLKYLWILGFFFVIIMMLRALRWKVLLPDNNCRFSDLYSIYMTSNLLNVFLPARAGDIFRGCYFGDKYKISKLNVLGTVAAERILDGLTVVGILLIGMSCYGHSSFMIKLSVTASILFAVSFGIMFYICKNKLVDNICLYIKEFSKKFPVKISEFVIKNIDKINPFLNSFVMGFETFTKKNKLIYALFLCVIAWTGDCLFVNILLHGYNIHISWVAGLLVTSFIALSTIIPSSSMYVGLYQYAFILALELFGVEKSVALSVALSHQIILIIVYSIVSLFYLFKNNIKIREEINAEN